MMRPSAVVGAIAASVLALVTLGACQNSSEQTTCVGAGPKLSVEETRLALHLPENDDPATLQSRAFAEDMVEGAGFQNLTPDLIAQLCDTRSLADAEEAVTGSATRLWRRAVDRAQQHGKTEGTLPFSDDRPLYWARLRSTAAIRQWTPGFSLSTRQRLNLIEGFDRSSRGMTDIDLPAGTDVTRVIVSGFDPFSLDDGNAGTAPGAAANGIRNGNPSGATVLSLDGTQYRTADGRTAHIETYVLPVSYPEFERGYLEDTVGPFMEPGPRQVDASITMSQGGGDDVFDLEQWNARHHGVYPGNDRVAPCPGELAVKEPDCDIAVVRRWGGPAAHDPYDPHHPSQWTSTTLPIDAMITARTGAGVRRPPGDTWAQTSEAFGVRRHAEYTEFPDCDSPGKLTRNQASPAKPVPPDAGSCSYSGSGGNYLSNESAYRNTLLRDRQHLTIPAGHIHTPVMQHFATEFGITDDTLDRWRLAIAEQARNLVQVVADTA